MCGNGSVCIERRMPASSGDPVSTALHMSLAGNKCPNLKNDDLDGKIIASSRRVLLSEIQYEPAGSYTNTVLDSLKSKYIVLNANVCDNNVDIKVKNGPKDSSNKDCTNTNSNLSNSPKKVKPEVTLPVPKRVLYPPEAIQLGWQTTTPVGSGMVNLRNTCYLNSTLQALFHVPAFVNWILTDKIHSTKCGMINGTGHTECLICAVMKTLQFSQRNSGTPIKPLQIYTKLKLICKHFDHGHQEDAHEFLRYLIESMERSYLTIVQGTKLDSYSKETTPLNQIFGGYLRTEVTCLECRHVSITFQHFQDLLLDIRTVGSVDDALEAYFGREQLGEGEEAYKCEQCHRRVAATKKFSIQKAPNVLCIQLKRFGILGGKISKHVSLKQKLDLARYMHPSSSTAGELTYRLVSLISHIGPSSSCGHYTAIAASSTGFFYLFDDSMVRQVPLQTVLSTNAYVIVYELEPSSAARPVKPAPAFTVKSAANGKGLSVKSIQNGGSQSPVSVHKPTLLFLPSKAERTAALNVSSAPSSVPSFPLIASSSSQVNTSPKPTKMSNGISSPSKSLVPYTPNESSDSESENAAGYRSNKQFVIQSNIVKEEKLACHVNGLTHNKVLSLQSNVIKENKLPSAVNGFTKDVAQKQHMMLQSGGNKCGASLKSHVMLQSGENKCGASQKPHVTLQSGENKCGASQKPHVTLQSGENKCGASQKPHMTLQSVENKCGASQKPHMTLQPGGNKCGASNKETSSQSASTQRFVHSTTSSPKSSPKSCAPKNEKLTASLHSANHLPSIKKLPLSCEPPLLVMNGWHVSESLHSPNSSAGSSTGTSVGSSVGQWNVTDVARKSRLTEKVETVTTETTESKSAETTESKSIETPGMTGSSDCTSVHGASVNINGTCSNNNGTNGSSSSSSTSSSPTANPNANTNTYECNSSGIKDDSSSSSKMWDGSRNNGTVNELLKLSHRGYGSSNVTTWNGGKSEVEKEVETDKQEQRKRSHQSLHDEDMDRGKVKKVKNYAYSSSKTDSSGRRYNPFQDHQNRKNSWHANGNSKRQGFYRNYNNIDRYRNNHRVYHNQSAYRSWRN